MAHFSGLRTVDVLTGAELNGDVEGRNVLPARRTGSRAGAGAEGSCAGLYSKDNEAHRKAGTTVP